MSCSSADALAGAPAYTYAAKTRTCGALVPSQPSSFRFLRFKLPSQQSIHHVVNGIWEVQV